MNPVGELDALLARDEPLLALAPMQDITDLPFWRFISRYGGPDVYYTEYFRVHPTSHLEKDILRSITENPTGRPAIAQMIGNDIPSLLRTAAELQRHEIAGVDLNLGCPAPIVYRKCAGGGLLREPERVDAILGALRASISNVKFTVKTRLGFDSTCKFDSLLAIFQKHRPDLLTVHGRTVHEMYGPVVHYSFIAEAVRSLSLPVLANGNVDSPESALRVLRETSARGLMIGRGAIRNPWVFEQIRQAVRGLPIFRPRASDLLQYIGELYEAVKPPNLRQDAHVQKMKKYMNFIAVGVDPEGRFLHDIRRVTTESEFFATCERFLGHNDAVFATA
jgi:tRNA-dihydrouridine synthase B